MLRLGGNSDNTRMVIAAAFQKQKSTEDIAALLQSTFHGGNGFKTPEGEFSGVVRRRRHPHRPRPGARSMCAARR